MEELMHGTGELSKTEKIIETVYDAIKADKSESMPIGVLENMFAVWSDDGQFKQPIHKSLVTVRFNVGETRIRLRIVSSGEYNHHEDTFVDHKDVNQFSSLASEIKTSFMQMAALMEERAINEELETLSNGFMSAVDSTDAIYEQVNKIKPMTEEQ